MERDSSDEKNRIEVLLTGKKLRLNCTSKHAISVFHPRKLVLRSLNWRKRSKKKKVVRKLIFQRGNEWLCRCISRQGLRMVIEFGKNLVKFSGQSRLLLKSSNQIHVMKVKNKKQKQSNSWFYSTASGGRRRNNRR